MDVCTLDETDLGIYADFGGGENYCAGGIYAGLMSPGTYQQYLTSPAIYTSRIPDGVPDEVAGPIMCSASTMHRALIDSGLKAGQWVVFPGGGGGVGIQGVQIAKYVLETTAQSGHQLTRFQSNGHATDRHRRRQREERPLHKFRCRALRRLQGNPRRGRRSSKDRRWHWCPWCAGHCIPVIQECVLLLVITYVNILTPPQPPSISSATAKVDE